MEYNWNKEQIEQLLSLTKNLLSKLDDTADEHLIIKNFEKFLDHLHEEFKLVNSWMYDRTKTVELDKDELLHTITDCIIYMSFMQVFSIHSYILHETIEHRLKNSTRNYYFELTIFDNSLSYINRLNVINNIAFKLGITYDKIHDAIIKKFNTMINEKLQESFMIQDIN